MDSYSRESSKTWGKDFKSLMEDFPDIRAELTASRALSWSGRSLYSCKGGYSIFVDETFQKAQDACKEGIQSILNEAGINYIASTPGFHHSWVRVSIMIFFSRLISADPNKNFNSTHVDFDTLLNFTNQFEKSPKGNVYKYKYLVD